ncbi:MAG: 30S ribosomal protein S21 [Gemmataceae bacterium]|nr:30S ribosomal protein S21 [Gemmataceae bacterium]
MGVRVEVREGEGIGQALRRLNKDLRCLRLEYRLEVREMRHTKPSEARRRRIGNAKLKAQLAASRKRLKLGIE